MVRFDADADLSPLLEAMDHSRDGHPHWVVVDAPRRGTALPQETVAAASARGFVAVPVETYVRACVIGTAEFDERTLLLVDAARREPARAHAALLRAAAQSPRPHMLLTFAVGCELTRPGHVREARAVYTPAPLERESSHVRELLLRGSRATQFAACGRHAAAERLLRDVSGALARRDAHRHASRLMMMLGRMLTERGRTRSAFDALEVAVGYGQAARAGDLVVEGRLLQAMTRLDEAAFVQAEALCRAVLESPELVPALRAWAEAILADAMLWQERPHEAPEFDAEAVPDVTHSWPATHSRCEPAICWPAAGSSTRDARWNVSAGMRTRRRTRLHGSSPMPAISASSRQSVISCVPAKPWQRRWQQRAWPKRLSARHGPASSGSTHCAAQDVSGTRNRI